MKTILFDLDGTLLGMNQEEFIKLYFSSIATFLKEKGFDAEASLKAIQYGTYLMINNDGKESNEEVFWKCYTKMTNLEYNQMEPIFHSYYDSMFDVTKKSCKAYKSISDLVAYLKKQNIKMILATNPLFPSEATRKRITWAGLNPDDFLFITTYDNSFYCKPNLEYYKEILNRFNLDYKDVIMIGNDTTEDMCVRDLGIETFLVIDDLIDKNNIKDEFRRGTRLDIIDFIKEKEWYK